MGLESRLPYHGPNALFRIRDGRLYRASFDTFEDYCQARWSMSRRHVNRLIEASAVAENLGPMGPKLESERQARPLGRLEPEEQKQAWDLAVESAPDGKPTAKQVEAAAEVVSPKQVPIPGPSAICRGPCPRACWTWRRGSARR
jgi:hypothetical protein